MLFLAVFHLFFPSCLKPHASLLSSLSSVHSSLSLSLLCIHQDGNGQASWLHLKRHTYQGALPLHLSFSLRLKHGPCQCTGWIYHSLSLSLFIPALLCCHCYHAAVQVRKGLSGYSSHYWLLNLVMVVKALAVPPCLRGQLMACFMSLQRRASLLGHRFSLAPHFPVHASSQRQDGWIVRPRIAIYLSPSVERTWAAKKASKVPYYPSESGRPCVICDSRSYKVRRLARLAEWKQLSSWGWQAQFSKFIAHFKKLSFFTIP